MTNLLDLKNPPPEEPIETADEPVEGANLVGFLGPTEVAWEAHDVLSDKARQRHYYVLGGFAVLGGLVAFWQSSWTTFLVVFFGIAAWELKERLTQPVNVHIHDRGVTINGHHYEHAQLTSFDIHRMQDGSHVLSLLTDQWHVPHLRLPLGEQDPLVVRDVMRQYVPEATHPVPLFEWLIRK